MRQAWLLIMNMGPGMREAATALADAAYKMVSAMPGFVSATYMIFDEEKGDYGSLTVWQSAADAGAAAETLNPWLQEQAGDKLTAPPRIFGGEVYEPG